MAGKIVKKPVGIVYDILVKVCSLIFRSNYAILDCEVNFHVPTIFGKPFLKKSRTLIDFKK